MNYGKRSTSKKQKSMHSKSAKAGKKASVIFIKAFLVCLLAAGVIGNAFIKITLASESSRESSTMRRILTAPV